MNLSNLLEYATTAQFGHGETATDFSLFYMFFALFWPFCFWMELPAITVTQILPYEVIVPDLVDVVLGLLPEDLLGFLSTRNVHIISISDKEFFFTLC